MEEISVASRIKRRKRRRAAALAGMVILAGAGLLFFYFRIYKVVPVFSEMTCEYGDSVSQNIED